VSVVGNLVDLSKEDFVLTKMYIAEASKFDRASQGKTDLVFVKFVGSRGMSVSPTFLYFGDLTVDQLLAMKGSFVDVLLGGNDKGFNVKLIQEHVPNKN